MNQLVDYEKLGVFYLGLEVDPQSDMGNLLLTFPDLRPEDFSPWVDPALAAKKNLTVPQYAEEVATTWKQG